MEQLDCNSGNYQCGGKCQPQEYQCKVKSHKKSTNKALSAAASKTSVKTKVVDLQNTFKRSLMSGSDFNYEDEALPIYQANMEKYLYKKSYNEVIKISEIEFFQKYPEKIDKYAFTRKKTPGRTAESPGSYKVDTEEWTEHEGLLSNSYSFKERQMTRDEISKIDPELIDLADKLNITLDVKAIRDLTKVDPDAGLFFGLYDSRSESIYMREDLSDSGKYSAMTILRHEFIHQLQHELTGKTERVVPGGILPPSALLKPNAEMRKVMKEVDSHSSYENFNAYSKWAEYEAFYLMYRYQILEKMTDDLQSKIAKVRESWAT